MNKFESKHFVLEIGVGAYPFPAIGERKIGVGEVYLGIDNGSRTADWNEKAIKRLSEMEEKGDSLSLAAADAECLPLQSNSVDEVVMSNLFGDPRLNSRIPYMVWEGQRVLKPGGLLVVVETLTPNYCPIRGVKDWVIPLGFGVQEAYEGISRELLRYHSKKWINSEDPFYIKFKKL